MYQVIEKTRLITMDRAYAGYNQELILRNRSEATIKYYNENYKYFRSFIGGESYVHTIDRNTILGFIDYLLTNHSRSYTSINTALRAVKAFLNWCHEQGYIDKVKVPLAKDQPKVKEVYSDLEIKSLIQYPDEGGLVEWRDWAIVCMLTGTGIRAGTLINLRVRDICFVKNTALMLNTKTRRFYQMQLTEDLKQDLLKYLELVPKRQEDYLFSTVDNSQLTVSRLYKTLSEYCRKRGVEKQGVHLFRHTFAVGYVKNGGDFFKLNRILDQSDIRVTMGYARHTSVIDGNFDQHNPLSNLR